MTFHERQHGDSKLDSKIVLDFAALVTTKLTNGAVSARFFRSAWWARPASSSI